MNTKNIKALFGTWWFWIIVVVILGLVFFLFALYQSHAWPDPNKKYITAVPVDLTQIQSISKYRSCAGHVRDGYNFDHQREFDSSMKHYLFPIPEFQGTLDKVKIYAPFDGKIIKVFHEGDKVVPGRTHNGNGLDIVPYADKYVVFRYGHFYFLNGRDFKVGDKVKTGELLGYAALGGKENDFDIDLVGVNTFGNEHIEVLGSAFDHMTKSVLAEFAKYGITPENTKFSKEEREKEPCEFAIYGSEPSKVCKKFSTTGDATGRENDCWVQLKQSFN